MNADEIPNRIAFGGGSDLLAAELRKIVASTSNLHSQLMGIPHFSAELVDPFLSMTDRIVPSVLDKFIAEAQAAHALQQEQWKAAFAASTRAWDQFDWKGIHEQIQQSLERADHVGKLGWTFSMDMTLPDIARLSVMEKEEDADAYMNDWYEENDADLTESEKQISEMNGFSSFQPSLSQCFSAYRRTDFQRRSTPSSSGPGRFHG
jgi:hypothetical protein